MANKVPASATLPTSVGAPTNYNLLLFCHALVRALYQILGEHAQRLNTAVMADGTEGYAPTAKRLNETTNTDTTFNDDAELKFAVEANEKYWFRFVVFYDTPTAADFKWQLAGPSSPTLILYDGFALPPGATSLTITRDTAFGSAHSLTETSGTKGRLVVEGILHNGSNEGTVAFQWAQNTSNGSNTTVYAGSYVEWGKVP